MSESNPHRTRHRRRRALVSLAAVASTVGAGVTALAPATAHAAPAPSPLVLTMPKHVEMTSEDGYVFDYGSDYSGGGSVSLTAVGADFSLWSHRARWNADITTQVRHGSVTTNLPAGSMKSWQGLHRFLDVTVRTPTGRRLVHVLPTICLAGESTRVVPDGAAHSTYPQGCPGNPYTLGSVQGIAKGWATQVQTFGDRPVKLKPGRYVMTVRIRRSYQKAFGMAPADAQRTVKLRVTKGEEEDGRRAADHRRTSEHDRSRVAKPASETGPTGRRLTAAPDGPRPDLASLPAWGIGLTGRYGNRLAFSATEWNGGTSPLVVDGFRRPGKDIMNAYEYFYDSDGNQLGYQPVGTMKWDPRPTHQHWHFEDFARYRLLNANKVSIQRSHKEAWCLANTDAVDYTIPEANWRPDSTDLATACGGHEALAVREVLDSGSGDTYDQYRAGQAFDLHKIPNGIYYISVEVNPNGNLVESDTTNNVALRKIKLGGRTNHRTLKVYKLGKVTEDPRYEEDDF